jgi:hypothetical protein
VTGELHPLSISIKKVFKKMDKKMYFEPEMEVINLKLQGMLCASGDIDEDDGSAPSGDGSNPGDPFS